MMRWNLVAALALLGAAPSVSAPQRLVLAPSGNEARYRAREQLANVSFPSDAVGTTQGVTGAIVIGDDGKIVTAQSSIVVDLTTLKSDRERRDRFIQGLDAGNRSIPDRDARAHRRARLAQLAAKIGRVQLRVGGGSHDSRRLAPHHMAGYRSGHGLRVRRHGIDPVHVRGFWTHAPAGDGRAQRGRRHPA